MTVPVAHICRGPSSYGLCESNLQADWHLETRLVGCSSQLSGSGPPPGLVFLQTESQRLHLGTSFHTRFSHCWLSLVLSLKTVTFARRFVFTSPEDQALILLSARLGRKQGAIPHPPGMFPWWLSRNRTWLPSQAVVPVSLAQAPWLLGPPISGWWLQWTCFAMLSLCLHGMCNWKSLSKTSDGKPLTHSMTQQAASTVGLPAASPVAMYHPGDATCIELTSKAARLVTSGLVTAKSLVTKYFFLIKVPFNWPLLTAACPTHPSKTLPKPTDCKSLKVFPGACVPWIKGKSHISLMSYFTEIFMFKGS